MVGRGIFGYTYALDYRGFDDMETICTGGGKCQLVGGQVGMSKAEIFLKTPPSQVVPTFKGVSNVNLPRNVGDTIPTEVKFTVDAISVAISTFGGVPGTILGFVSPTKMFDDWDTWTAVKTNRAGSSGGGLRVNTQVFEDKRVVSGQMDWDYAGAGTQLFTYQVEPTIKQVSSFHACFDCNWIEDHSTWYTNYEHDARFRVI